MPFGRRDEATKRCCRGEGFVKKKTNRRTHGNFRRIDRCPEDICYVLALARLAPPAANSQMWRFGLHHGFHTIVVAKPVGYRHFKWEHPNVDIGMCAAHIWLGLLGKGYTPTVDVKIDMAGLWMFDL